MRAAPEKKLDERVVKAWRIEAALSMLILAVGVIFLAVISFTFDVIPGWIITLSIALWVILAISTVGIVPSFRYRRWRFDVTKDEVDLMEGIFFRKRTIIPLVRVQSVDTSQGPVLRMLGISTVSVATAAGTHAIPALSEDEAATLRDHISALARVAQEDV